VSLAHRGFVIKPAGFAPVLVAAGAITPHGVEVIHVSSERGRSQPGDLDDALRVTGSREGQVAENLQQDREVLRPGLRQDASPDPDSHSTTSEARSTYIVSWVPTGDSEPALVVIFGSVITGKPCIWPTTCWDATSVSTPATFIGEFAAGRNNGRSWLSSKLKNQPHRRGCITITSGGKNRVV
jgi:hypothetical protein